MERRKPLFTKVFWRGAAERCIKTVAQTAAALLAGDGLGLLDVNWVPIASIAGLAGLVSLLTSIANPPFISGEVSSRAPAQASRNS